MKWVWNEAQDEAINLDHVTSLEIQSLSSPGWGVFAYQSIGHSPTFLRTFPTYEAAHEFISNLTGAAGAKA